MSAIFDAHKKKVGVEQLYNSVQTKFNQLEIRCSRENQRSSEVFRRLRLSSWSSDQLEIRCGRENQHPEKIGPPAPGWAAQENGKETLLWP